jgi:hypothetical protein
MDSTWKIILSRVSPILMLSIVNVGIPVALTIGPKEDKALYETFYRVFSEEFVISLMEYRVVSDQGRALRAVYALHGNEQFFCLRHFLVSLKLKIWSDDVGNLIRCCVRGNFERLCAIYQRHFAEALVSRHSPKATRLVKVLGNMGLSFEEGRIVSQDGSKWRAVSMMERVPVRLPSTSNGRESLHGHGNEATPRRNEFIASLIRVASMMIRKTLSFQTALEDNFGVMTRVGSRRTKHPDPQVLASERIQYCTTLDHCDCGETCHLSAMYRTACPYSHQYSLGAAKPVVPDLDLDLDEDVPDLNLVIHPLECPEVIAPSNPAKLQAQAVRQIKWFSHSRKTMEIEASVQNHFVIGDEFALGRPISVFRLIGSRIGHFSQCHSTIQLFMFESDIIE